MAKSRRKRESVTHPEKRGLYTRKPHRPRIFDKPDWPNLREAVIGFTREGYYVEDAMRAAGLTPQWWYKWQAIAEGELAAAHERMNADGGDDVHEYIEADQKICVEFIEAIRRAQAERIILNAREIHRSNPLEYNARVRPADWGRKDRVLMGADPEHPPPAATHVHVYLPDNARGKPKDDA
jgi:DNA-binding GntR family transcriptional regulator